MEKVEKVSLDSSWSPHVFSLAEAGAGSERSWAWYHHDLCQDQASRGSIAADASYLQENALLVVPALDAGIHSRTRQLCL